MTLRVYADPRFLDRAAPHDLTDIARALWGEGLESGAGGAGFTAVPTPAESDVCLLPMKWRYYVARGAWEAAREAALQARRAWKPLVVFSEGDFPANIPLPDAVLFEQSVRRSRMGPRSYALPVFIPDLLGEYFGGELPVRRKGGAPVVGFCGQAARGRLPAAARWARMRLRRLAYHAGRRTWEPPAVEHTSLRRRVLDALGRGGRVGTNFVLRDRYRAGISLERRRDPRDPTRLEFIENIAGSDYTVCMRGQGNFSVRLYEVLSLGRIPVYVDTDGLLPFTHVLPWRELCVWVEAHEVAHVAEKVADFHHALSPAAFVERQRELRAIWERWLTPRGFYGNFHLHFPELRAAAGQA